MKKKSIIVLGSLFLIGIGAWMIFGADQRGVLNDNDKVDLSREEEKDLRERLEIALTKVEDVKSLKYEVALSLFGGEFANFWEKGELMRMEVGSGFQKTINLINKEKDEAYLVMPLEGIAVEMEIENMGRVFEGSIKEQAIPLFEHDLDIIGTESVNEKECIVVKYSDDGGEVKIWVWEEYGLPLRVEAETEQRTVTMEAKNVEFVDIPDSMFELPDNVEITEDIPYF